ncbi:MAG: CBS domain-containing protein [Pirellulales bacterium]|nr:CBS domain-containing protein [Pirellulales bacterium]
MMTLQDILHAKGTTVHRIAPGATLGEAMSLLAELNMGALVVTPPETPDGPPVGIVTERDFLRFCAKYEGRWQDVPVEQLMTRAVITGGPEDTIAGVMGLMVSRRIRHLPVVASGRLVGLVSIGDVVKAHHDRLAMENHFMRSYIQNP